MNGIDLIHLNDDIALALNNFVKKLMQSHFKIYFSFSASI